MNLVDVHAHLSYKGLIENIDNIIKDSENAGLKVIITQGTEPESNRNALELSKKFSIVKPALGFYPTHIAEYEDSEIEEELKFIRNNDCIAIGEVGLDYFLGRNSELTTVLTEEVKDRMKLYFKKLIQIAIDKDVPLIVHSRKAELDTIEVLEEMKAKKVIMHCFSGKKKYIQRILDNGWYFSIPCNLERALHFQHIVKVTPINKLFTETDAPYLGPIKTETNVPANVLFTVKKIAEIKNMDEIEVSNNIFMNYQNFFI